jgi:hypothetical protein
MRHLDMRLAVFVAALAAVIVAGCVLDEPEVDERWTLVEFLDVSPAPGQTRTASQPIQVNVNGRITYRRIVTGFLVAEVRYSDTISPQNVVLKVLLRFGQFVLENQCIEGDVSLHATPVQELHEFRQVGLGEIMRPHPGIETLQTKVDRVCSVLDSSLRAFPVTSRCQQLRDAPGGLRHVARWRVSHFC